MASSSGQGSEPPPESNAIQVGERWGDRLSDGAGNGGVGFPLQTHSTVVTPCQAAVEQHDFGRSGREQNGEGFDEEELDNTPRQSSISWRRIRPFFFEKLFPGLATVVCILNITAALGYVLLMNDPTSPKSSFVAGTLFTWFSTSGMMICYGILNTGSMRDYTRHLLILAIFTCFVVSIVFHFAGASNFASSFLVGITMAVLLIQVW